MKHLALIVFLSTALSIQSFAQTQELQGPFVFESKTIDFGNIKEADGPVAGSFFFVNSSGGDVKIENVSTSCNCTTLDFPLRPILKGEFCELPVRLNPANMEGKIFREVSLTADKVSYHLTITATVEAAPIGLEDLYSSVIGENVRSAALEYRFGYAAQGRSQSQSIMLCNTGSKAVQLRAESSNPFLVVKCPYTLKPGAADGMIVTYSVPVGPQNYGQTNDIITLFIDGKKAEKNISLSAILVDDLDRDDAKAPNMQLVPAYFTFNKIKKGKTAAKQCTIVNNGKKDLIIRYVKTSTRVATSLKAGMVVKPGENLNVSVSMEAPDKEKASAEGTVYFITNDPLRPQKEIQLMLNTK